MSVTTGTLKTAFATAVVLIGAQAYADAVKHVTRTNTYISNGDLRDVPLDDAGNRFTTFSGSGRFTIFYSAECAVQGLPQENYLEIDIVVDGVELPPTGNNDKDAFCTANHTITVDDGGVTATTSGRTASLPVGTHTVVIKAQAFGGASLTLADSALLIFK